MSELVKECHHGRLTRQCRECDMEKEICELQSKLTTITKQRDDLADMLNFALDAACQPYACCEDFCDQVLELLSTIKEQEDDK